MRKILCISAGVIVVGLYGYHVYGLVAYTRAYGAYATAADRHTEAALIPAVAENPLRLDLNQALSDVLNTSLTPAHRIERAEAGLALLILAEGRIDAIGEVGKDVTDAIADLDHASGHWGLVYLRPTLRSLTEDARKRFEMVADVRGLSYRANHHTKEIFDRVITDNGTLTPEHASDLDRMLPALEEQFDRRSNLYEDIAKLESAMHKAYDDILKI